MSITDELRKWMDTIVMPLAVEVEIEAIADRIDEEHEAQLADAHAPTTEDILWELCNKFLLTGCNQESELIAEYAQKLQLKEKE